jgi:hypothetical protein
VLGACRRREAVRRARWRALRCAPAPGAFGGSSVAGPRS